MQDEKITYIQNHLKTPLSLIGMMGAGKSAIGSGLAKVLNVPFFDSDKIIEDKAMQSIADIFENFGEEKFRNVEAKTIQDLLNKDVCVISTGGGAITNEDTLKALTTKSACVYLRAPIKDLWERVKKSQNRPLLDAPNPQQVLYDLLSKRRTRYEKAHMIVDVDPSEPNPNIGLVINQLYGWLKKDNVPT